MDGPVIETCRLRREFGASTALVGLDLRVEPGRVFGLLGPNGAGKTTTLRLLLGLLEPTSGRARVLGLDPSSQGQALRCQSGVLFSRTGLYERLNAEQNLEFFARIWRLPNARRQRRIHELLSRLGLWERRFEPVEIWSRGMQQKLALARVLLHEPRLIFLDEPTAGLDPVAADDLRNDLRELVESQGTTVFLTTHNLAEAEKVCDHVGILRQGVMLACARPAALGERNGRRRAELIGRGFGPNLIRAIEQSLGPVEVLRQETDHLVLDFAEGREIDELARIVVEQGATIERLDQPRRGLEETFLELVRGEGVAGTPQRVGS